METLRLALSSIVEHRLRALLTTLGVVFGVMAVIAVTAIVQGFFRLYSDQLEGLGAGFLLVFPGNSQVEGARKVTKLTRNWTEDTCSFWKLIVSNYYSSVIIKSDS